MTDLFSTINRQFADMKAIAEANAKIAEQALSERDLAHKALLDCQQAMERTKIMLEDLRIESELEPAIAKCKAILEPAPVEFWRTP